MKKPPSVPAWKYLVSLAPFVFLVTVFFIPMEKVSVFGLFNSYNTTLLIWGSAAMLLVGMGWGVMAAVVARMNSVKESEDDEAAPTASKPKAS